MFLEHSRATGSRCAVLVEFSPIRPTHSEERSMTLPDVVSREEWCKASRGWDFPWYSSHGTEFNYDFNVTIDSSVGPVMFNFRTLSELEANGMGWLGDGSTEQPGYSMFLRDGDSVFHTYSVYARGTE